MDENCPRSAALSAYIDEEMNEADRFALDAHLRACPVCGHELSELLQLRHAFHRLPEEKLSFDLGGVIEGRLAAERAPRTTQRPRPSPWMWLPASAGGAAALLLGIYLGSTLLTAGAVTPRVAAMAVFDPVPPGNLCVASPSCYTKGAQR